MFCPSVPWTRLRGTLAQRFDFSLPAVFIARRDEAISSETSKAERWSGANHGSIGDSWPIAFSGCPRGPRVSCETKCPRHIVPNFTAETRSRTRVSQEPDGHHRRRSPAWSGLDRRHSSCLWFQRLGVEAHSSLPYDQHDCGNFSSQG